MQAQLSDAAKFFIQYEYTEVKDLAKEGITVMTALLLFSLTFREKMVGRNPPKGQRHLLLFVLILQLISTFMCVEALYVSSVAYFHALSGISDFQKLGMGANSSLAVAMVLFMLSVSCLLILPMNLKWYE